MLVDAGNASKLGYWHLVIEYKYLIVGYYKMGYKVLNFGNYEQYIPAEDFKKIIKYSPDKELPFITANIFFKDGSRFAPAYRVIDVKGLKIGFLGVTEKNIEMYDYKFKKIDTSIERYLPELLKKSDVQILLATVNEEKGFELAKKYPQFEIVFFGGKEKQNRSLKNNSIFGPVATGKNGGSPFVIREGDFGRFQMVAQLNFKKGKLKNIQAKDYELTEKYKDDEYYAMKWIGKMDKELQAEARRRVNQAAVPEGPDSYYPAIACTGDEDNPCHTDIYEVWEKVEHSNAYIKLIEAKKLKSKKFGNVWEPKWNPRCVGCHTMGFGDHNGGFISPLDLAGYYESNKGVSCGACHGYCMKHGEIEDPMLKSRLGIYPQYRKPGIEICKICHDKNHDPDFKFEEAMKEISFFKFEDGTVKKHFELKDALKRYQQYRNNKKEYYKLLAEEKKKYEEGLEKYKKYLEKEEKSKKAGENTRVPKQSSRQNAEVGVSINTIFVICFFVLAGIFVFSGFYNRHKRKV